MRFCTSRHRSQESRTFGIQGLENNILAQAGDLVARLRHHAPRVGNLLRATRKGIRGNLHESFAVGLQLKAVFNVGNLAR